MKQIFFFGLCMLFFSVSLCAQSTDSIIIQKDSLKIKPKADSVDSFKTIVTKAPVLVFKLKNKLLNLDGEPVSIAVQVKKNNSKDTMFYIIAGMILFLAFFKYFYNRYFTNLFRVFFNTSLRQSQLTDQLLQAKLPSLFFNLFFVVSAGIYVYILLSYYHFIDAENKLVLILFSITLVSLIYFIKFCILKFTGWITGLVEVADTYIFVVFLINKIIGVFLVPFIIILSFSDPALVNITVLISLMSIGIFLLLRFFRSYGLLQNQLKISRFHFLMYIIGIELLPLLLIYKGLMVFLTKIL
ncbi:MAG: DUF4271 domain-containing protein [Ferruginibacter sp.]